MDALKLDTVRLAADRSCLEILDQTLLPGTVKVLRIEKIEDIFEAIRFFARSGRAGHRRLCRLWDRAYRVPVSGTQDYETFLARFQRAEKISGFLTSDGGQSVLGVRPNGAHTAFAGG